MTARNEHKPRFIVTRTDADHKPFGIYDRDRSRFVASYADSADVRDALVTYYGWTPSQACAIDFDAIDAEPTTPDNAGELGSLIAELAGGGYVTTMEAAEVILWCSEWVRDTFAQPDDEPQTIEGSKLTDETLLRGCQHHIDGGLAFVLADVRRVAKESHPLREQWAQLRRDGSTRMTFEQYRACTEKPRDEHDAGMEVLAAKFAEQDAAEGHVESPYRIMRQHTGTEDGSLWYVTTRDGSQVSGDGHVERESAEWELAELDDARAELASLERKQAWAREHPYAEHCGDDDARADRIDELRAELTPMVKPDLDDYSGFAR